MTIQDINEATAQSQWFHRATEPKETGEYLTIGIHGTFQTVLFDTHEGWKERQNRVLFWSNISFEFEIF